MIIGWCVFILLQRNEVFPCEKLVFSIWEVWRMLLAWWILSTVLLYCAAVCQGAVLTPFAGTTGNRSSGVGNGSVVIEVRSTLNRDTKFGRWTSSRIPYRLDQNYSKQKWLLILIAFLQMIFVSRLARLYWTSWTRYWTSWTRKTDELVPIVHQWLTDFFPLAPFQKSAIREAMTQIQDDVSNCLRFTEYDSRTDMGEDFINIAPTEEGSVLII